MLDSKTTLSKFLGVKTSTLESVDPEAAETRGMSRVVAQGTSDANRTMVMANNKTNAFQRIKDVQKQPYEKEGQLREGR